MSIYFFMIFNVHIFNWQHVEIVKHEELEVSVSLIWFKLTLYLDKS